MKVAGWCEAHYIDLMPHNPLGADLHRGDDPPRRGGAQLRLAGVQPLALPPTPEFEDALFPVRPALSGTSFAVDRRPGIGIEIDEALLRSDRFRHWNPPQLRRGDGSVTNW